MAAVPSSQILKTAFQVFVFCALNPVDILQLPENNYLGIGNFSKSIGDEQVSFVILENPLMNTTILTLDQQQLQLLAILFCCRWPLATTIQCPVRRWTRPDGLVPSLLLPSRD